MTDTLLEQLQRVNAENEQLKADASARDAWELTYKEMLEQVKGETLGEKIQRLLDVTVALMYEGNNVQISYSGKWDATRKHKLA